MNKRAAQIFTPQFLKSLPSGTCVPHASSPSRTTIWRERMSRFNPNVAVVPNMIDAALPTMQRVRRDRVTIGWAGGDSHARDLGRITTPLHRIVRDGR